MYIYMCVCVCVCVCISCFTIHSLWLLLKLSFIDLLKLIFRSISIYSLSINLSLMPPSPIALSDVISPFLCGMLALFFAGEFPCP